MRTWQRYLLLQIPGWALAIACLWAAWRWLGLPSYLAVLFFLGFLLKDYLLYPFLRRAFESDAPSGTAALVGSVGVAQQDLAPVGFVRVNGELWQATAAEGQTIHARARVLVTAARGMTLIVAPAKGGGSHRHA